MSVSRDDCDEAVCERVLRLLGFKWDVLWNGLGFERRGLLLAFYLLAACSLFDGGI